MIPLASATTPISPPNASTSRTIWPFASPPIAGLQLMTPTVPGSIVTSATTPDRAGSREAAAFATAQAASTPACPPPITMTRNRSMTPTIVADAPGAGAATVPPAMPVRDATPADVDAIAAICNHAIVHTDASLWLSPRPPAEFGAQVAAATPRHPWLVDDEGGVIAGSAWAKPYNIRDGYAHTAEVSVYIHHEHRRRGVGTRLYAELFGRLRDGGHLIVIAGISLPNPGSVRLHESFGMKQVALFPEVGRKFDRWVDVGYWQGRLDADPAGKRDGDR